MRVKVAKYAGFCSGVQKALAQVLEELERGQQVYILGTLVHNEAVEDYLTARGVIFVDSPDEVPAGGTLIIRTHGVSPAVLAKIKQRKEISYREATCPRVKKVQELAHNCYLNGVQVIIYGNSSHPEVEGVCGWAGGEATVVSSVADLGRVKIRAPAALLAQTTAKGKVFSRLEQSFKNRLPAGQVLNTLCPETMLRQEEALRLAKEVEAIVVVGSPNSANNAVLVDICEKVVPTCRVAGAGELKPQFLEGKNAVGVVAGASTPHWTIKEVVEKMENENFGAHNEENEIYKENTRKIQAGEQLTGQVVQVNEEEAMIDIGYKTEAQLPRSEVYLDEGETLPDRFPVGSKHELTVIALDDQEGKAVVSYKRLAREKRWRELEAALEEQTTRAGKVKQVVPAGMVVELGNGIEGFMPGSLVDIRYIPDFNQFMGQEVQFKVIEINREKDKVILSRKKLLEEEAAKKKEEVLNSLEAGSVITGIVRRLTDFGAFVDVGGIDGLVHVSEISWERIDHPRDVLQLGEEIQVKVLDVDPERERISLSLRQVLPDPWTRVLDEFQNGQVVKGKITRLVNFGAFVELMPGVEGLVHVSQIADYHVKHPSEVLTEGEVVNVKILELKPEVKRISLSIKEAGGGKAAEKGQAQENGEASGGITIGDVFGDLLQGAGAEEVKTAAEQALAEEPEPSEGEG